jgi:hypothetical protein
LIFNPPCSPPNDPQCKNLRRAVYLLPQFHEVADASVQENCHGDPWKMV